MNHSAYIIVLVALIGGEASGEGEAAARDAAARLAAFDIARF